MAEILGALQPGRVAAQAFHPFVHRFVKLRAQPVLGVRGNVGQQALQRIRHHGRTLVAQPVGGQELFLARVLSLEPADQRAGDELARFFLLQYGHQPRERLVQQLLVAPALGERGEQLGAEPCQVHLPYHRAQRALHKALDLRIFQRLQRSRQHARHLRGHQTGIGRAGEPMRHQGGRVAAADQRNQGIGVEKLLTHKLRQVVPNAVLVARDDGGVPRDERQGHAVKQRSHRKPVGQRAHHGGFSHGFEGQHRQMRRCQTGACEHGSGQRQQT